MNMSNSTCVSRNYHYHNKKGLKITAIVDKFKLPICNIDIKKGSVNDCKIGLNIVKKLPDKFFNRGYLLADKGYDSSIFKKIIKKKDGKPMIPENLRNKKNKTDIKLLKKMFHYYLHVI